MLSRGASYGRNRRGWHTSSLAEFAEVKRTLIRRRRRRRSGSGSGAHLSVPRGALLRRTQAAGSASHQPALAAWDPVGQRPRGGVSWEGGLLLTSTRAGKMPGLLYQRFGAEAFGYGSGFGG